MATTELPINVEKDDIASALQQELRSVWQFFRIHLRREPVDRNCSRWQE